MLNIDNFFNRYIITPLAPELTEREKALAFLASFCLAPLTLGIPHIICFFRNRNITSLPVKQSGDNTKFSLEKAFHRTYEKVNQRALELLGGKVSLAPSKTDQKELSLNRSIVNSSVQEIINLYYSKPMPSEADVTVPFDGKWVSLAQLTPQQVLQLNNKYAHPKDQLPDNDQGAAAAYEKILPKGSQRSYLPNDPRHYHGSDHAARTALFSAVFAYLYHKYHPECHLSKGDFALIQIVGAGHDSARQTEGVDLYDDRSADFTIEQIKKLGIADPSLLKQCREAIADKDNGDLKNKSFIAKSVQCGDSAEYARLLLQANWQSEGAFEGSRAFLDIYNEISALANNNPEAPLKNGFSYADFLFELDGVRKEMNHLIFSTHQKAVRAQFSEEGKNYYRELLRQVTHFQYPLLTEVATAIEIKIEPSVKRIRKQLVKEATSWLISGHAKEVSQEKIESYITRLGNCSRTPEIDRLILSFQELKKNKLAEKETAIRPLEERNADIARTHSDTLESDLSLSATLWEQSAQGESLHSDRARCASKLLKHADRATAWYRQAPAGERDSRLLTSAALAYEMSARFYLSIGATQTAREVLQRAALNINFEEAHPLNQIGEILQSDSSPLFRLRDCGFLRKRELRVAAMNVDGKNYIEFSADLPSKVRSNLNPYLEALGSDPTAHCHETDTFFPLFKDGKYDSSVGCRIGSDVSHSVSKDLKVTFPDIKATVFIGSNERYFNAYRHLRIRVEKNCTLQDIHKAFCRIGLPMALTDSRDVDIYRHKLALALHSRYPALIYNSVAQGREKREVEIEYQHLNPEQKVLINNDIKNMEMEQVGQDQFVFINPLLSKEAWDAGARCLSHFIGAKDISEGAQRLASMLRGGLLSSQERYHRGILGAGCCPGYNFMTGSGNQVFTRILTKNIFEKKTPLAKFAVKGPLFLLLDVKALERIPYSYPADRGGLRNPAYSQRSFTPEMQAPINNYHGHERLQERGSYPSYFRGLTETECYLNETMFDTALSGKYIIGAVVATEGEKLQVMKELTAQNIHEIRGVPLASAIVVAEALTPALLADIESRFHQ